MSAPSHSAMKPSHPNTIRLECAQSSQQGRRAQNEDSAAWNEIDESILAIVADGMGGGLDGKRFSGDAVAKVQAAIISRRKEGVGTPQITAALSDAATALRDLRASDPRYHASGTTLVVAGVAPAEGGAHVSLMHVGDSRAYLIHANGQAELLTRDHTYAEQLIHKGVPPDEAHSHAQAARLIHALGDDLDLVTLPDVASTARLTAGDSLLLCTDGVSKALQLEQIAAAVAGRPAQDAVTQLIDQALRAGANDNVTALVIRCVPLPTRRLPLSMILFAIVAVIAITVGVLALLRLGRPDPTGLPSPGPTITPLTEEPRETPKTTSTPNVGETSTPAPSVLPSNTPTNTPSPTATNTASPTRRPKPSDTPSPTVSITASLEPSPTPEPSPTSTPSPITAPLSTPTPTTDTGAPGTPPTPLPAESQPPNP